MVAAYYQEGALTWGMFQSFIRAADNKTGIGIEHGWPPGRQFSALSYNSAIYHISHTVAWLDGPRGQRCIVFRGISVCIGRRLGVGVRLCLRCWIVYDSEIGSLVSLCRSMLLFAWYLHLMQHWKQEASPMHECIFQKWKSFMKTAPSSCCTFYNKFTLIFSICSTNLAYALVFAALSTTNLA